MGSPTAFCFRKLFQLLPFFAQSIIFGLAPHQFLAKGLVFFRQILDPLMIVFRLRPSHPDYGNRSNWKCSAISFAGPPATPLYGRRCRESRTRALWSWTA